MSIKQIAGIGISISALVFGCSGNNANIRNLSESESKAIQQELLDNWSDYNISYNQAVIVFDPKNDDTKILVPNGWYTVKDQETWTQIVNGFKTVHFGVNQVWGEPIREIRVRNQFYGYISHGQGMVVAAKIVNENTVRLFAHSGNWGKG
jgi:hypothetical protein